MRTYTSLFEPPEIINGKYVYQIGQVKGKHELIIEAKSLEEAEAKLELHCYNVAEYISKGKDLGFVKLCSIMPL